MCTNRPIFNFSHSTDYTTEFSKFSAQNLRLPQGMYSNDLIGFIYKILVVDHNARPSSSELAQVPQIVSAVKRLIERGVYDTSILNDLDYTLKHTPGNRTVQSGDDDLSRRGSRSISTSRTSRPSSVHPIDLRKSSKQCGHAHAQPLESLESVHGKGLSSGGFHDHGAKAMVLIKLSATLQEDPKRLTIHYWRTQASTVMRR